MPPRTRRDVRKENSDDEDAGDEKSGDDASEEETEDAEVTSAARAASPEKSQEDAPRRRPKRRPHGQHGLTPALPSRRSQRIADLNKASTGAAEATWQRRLNPAHAHAQAGTPRAKKEVATKDDILSSDNNNLSSLVRRSSMLHRPGERRHPADGALYWPAPTEERGTPPRARPERDAQREPASPSPDTTSGPASTTSGAASESTGERQRLRKRMRRNDGLSPTLPSSSSADSSSSSAADSSDPRPKPLSTGSGSTSASDPSGSASGPDPTSPGANASPTPPLNGPTSSPTPPDTERADGEGGTPARTTSRQDHARPPDERKAQRADSEDDDVPPPPPDEQGEWMIRRLTPEEQLALGREFQLYPTPPDHPNERLLTLDPTNFLNQKLVLKMGRKKPRAREANDGLQTPDPELVKARLLFEGRIAKEDKPRIELFQERHGTDVEYDSSADEGVVKPMAIPEADKDKESWYNFQTPHIYTTLDPTGNEARAFLRKYGAVALYVPMTDEEWGGIHAETFDAVAANWNTLCELNSQNDQKRKNDGLRRFLVMQASSYKDLMNKVLTHAELFAPRHQRKWAIQGRNSVAAADTRRRPWPDGPLGRERAESVPRRMC